MKCHRDQMFLDKEPGLLDRELAAARMKLAKLLAVLNDRLDDPVDHRALCLPVSENRRVRPRDEEILVLARIRPGLDGNGRPVRDRLEEFRLRGIEAQDPGRIRRGKAGHVEVAWTDGQKSRIDSLFSQRRDLFGKTHTRHLNIRFADPVELERSKEQRLRRPSIRRSPSAHDVSEPLDAGYGPSDKALAR